MTISRISHLPSWPVAEGRPAFHAASTGSINAHRSSDKSLGYGKRRVLPPRPGPVLRLGELEDAAQHPGSVRIGQLLGHEPAQRGGGGA
ncbi:hypothetical protein [Streptomyces atratus]|uniref:hypothetical protein n=1 Tax=Streptomyces atratus TaxID=1893 RepID=UPI0037A8629E